MRPLSPAARIARNGLLLALLCVVGMFSIPLGENIKVSLQFLMVMIVVLLSYSVWDALIVTGAYLLLGLFLPIYAGFTAGVSPTFGYVIAFVVVTPILFYMNRIPKVHPLLRMVLACVTSLLIVYLIGTLFMMAYLSRWDLGPMLLITVVPYLPFDAVKIFLAVTTVWLLPTSISGIEKKSRSHADTNS